MRAVLEEADPVAAVLDAAERDELLVVTTGGTSAAPRRVVRRARSWTASFPAVSSLTGLTARSRAWVPGPLTATMNLFAAAHARWAGAAPAAGPGDATHLQLTPLGLRRLLDPAPDDAPLAGRTAVVAGDALQPGLRERAEAAGLRVEHYYGAAELSFVAWGRDAHDLRPFPGVEVELRDGVVWARSPYLAEGVAGDDGFATTGDLGSWHDGALRVAGRPSAVTTGGATVVLADAEAALLGAWRGPRRGEVVVVGVAHPVLGGQLVAVLTDPDDEPAARAAARGLGAVRPQRFAVHPALPATAAGKVDRSALAALLAVRAGRPAR